jgi:hypothetical protein
MSTSAPVNWPGRFSLHYDSWGRLVLTDAVGEAHVGVDPVRAFPLSDSEQWISICDSAGNELECVRDIASAPAEIRHILDEALAQREFVPEILRIERISSDEPSQWDVETNRGRTIFFVHSGDDVRRVDGERMMIVDIHGIRYLISDERALDARSRHLIERYL